MQGPMNPLNYILQPRSLFCPFSGLRHHPILPRITILGLQSTHTGSFVTLETAGSPLTIYFIFLTKHMILFEG